MGIIPLLIPVVAALLLSFRLLFFSAKSETAFKVLGAYFLLLTLVLFATLLQYQRNFFPEINSIKPIYTIVFYGSILSLAPTGYFYIASLTDRINKYKKVDRVIPHYIIPVILLLVNIFSYMYFGLESQPNESTSELVRKVTYFSNFVALVYLFPSLSLFYVYKSFRIYFYHKKRIQQVFSYQEGVHLKWMLVFLIGYVFYVISFIILEPDSSPYFVYVPMLMYVIFIGFMGSKQRKVSIDKAITDSGNVLVENESKNTAIDQEKRTQLKHEITSYLEINEPYLDSQLTVYQLAKMVGTNSSYLSVVLNSDFEMNFTSFINSYRIKKAKALLISEESKNYTIEAIGHMSGFKSKSAFNRWFKEFTGETPSVYKRKLTAS